MADDGPQTIFEEVAEYIGFDAEDAALLVAAREEVTPAFDGLVDSFYVAVRNNPGAAKVFEGPAQIERLKKSLHGWMHGLFSGVYDDAYLARRARIGRVHVRIGLDQRYMFAAMNLVRTGLKDAVDEKLRPEVARRTRTAIDRICDIELALMLESYRDAYTSGLRSEQMALAHDLEQSETEKAELTRTASQHEALATIGTLTAGLAHEVRNPLNAAKLQLELIGRSAAKLDHGRSSRIRERVGLVNDELSRLSEMLDDFLALARQRHLERRSFELLPLITEVVELEGPLAEAEGIELRIGTCGATVKADRSKIKQVLVNLVSNAVDAMRGKGGLVELYCRPEDGKVSIEVADTGAGIPTEVRERVFEPFVTTKEAGTGLGLSIVKRIVESHGGNLDVSTSSDGTTIRFTLDRVGE